MKQVFDQGMLGLAWGTSQSEVMKAHPGAKVMVEGSLVSVQHPNTITGIRADRDTYLLHLDKARGFVKTTFQVPASDAPKLIELFTASIGSPRSVTITTIGGSTQVFEWSSSKASATVHYITKDASPRSTPLEPVLTSVLSGPLTLSYIDEYHKAREGK